MGQVAGRGRGPRGGRLFRRRGGRFPVGPVGLDAQGGEDGQGDGGQEASQGFREGAGSTGAGASSHGRGPVGVKGLHCSKTRPAP
ncbi:MAG: hypothetical protein P9F75_03370 [Candidatus Contendobacter sp.]|nr:hypothetical protein [Candidatus Contendobacter sp.]